MFEAALSHPNRDGVFSGNLAPPQESAGVAGHGYEPAPLQLRAPRHGSIQAGSPQIVVQTALRSVGEHEEYYWGWGSQQRPTIHANPHPNSSLNHYPQYPPAQLPWLDRQMSLNNSGLGRSTSNSGSGHVPALWTGGSLTSGHSDILEAASWHGQGDGLASIFEPLSEIDARYPNSVGNIDSEMLAYINSDAAEDLNCANANTQGSSTHVYGNPGQVTRATRDIPPLSFTHDHSQAAPPDGTQRMFGTQVPPPMSFLGLGPEPLVPEDGGSFYEASFPLEKSLGSAIASLEDEDKRKSYGKGVQQEEE